MVKQKYMNDTKLYESKKKNTIANYNQTKIIDLIKKHKLIIYGGHAINMYLPKTHQIKTTDYDLFSNNPQYIASLLADSIGGTYKEAIHPGTWKIFKKGAGIADVTKPETCIPWINKKGLRVPSLRWIYSQLFLSLSNPEHSWRWKKDLARLKLLDAHRIGTPYSVSKKCMKPDAQNNYVYTIQLPKS